MNSQGELVEHLRAEGVLKGRRIIKAFSEIDRKDFAPEEFEDAAHDDCPLQIGYGQTISQPTTVAHMLEWLAPHLGDKVLDVGSGSGWTTALLAHIVGPSGSVLGLELVPELVEFGQENLAKYNFLHARIEQASKKVLGYPKGQPFDRILVSASGESIPKELVSQLKKGGTIVIPVRDTIFEVHKNEKGAIETREHWGFAFVPLITPK
jgi:protein-L-isoaspartate(D-aspartate) O-methyltransferase